MASGRVLAGQDHEAPTTLALVIPTTGLRSARGVPARGAVGPPVLDWMPVVARQHLIVVTRDKRIRTRRAELRAYWSTVTDWFGSAPSRILARSSRLRSLANEDRLKREITKRGPGPWALAMSPSGVRPSICATPSKTSLIGQCVMPEGDRLSPVSSGRRRRGAGVAQERRWTSRARPSALRRTRARASLPGVTKSADTRQLSTPRSTEHLPKRTNRRLDSTAQPFPIQDIRPGQRVFRRVPPKV